MSDLREGDAIMGRIQTAAAVARPLAYQPLVTATEGDKVRAYREGGTIIIQVNISDIVPPEEEDENVRKSD